MSSQDESSQKLQVEGRRSIAEIENKFTVEQFETLMNVLLKMQSGAVSIIFFEGKVVDLEWDHFAGWRKVELFLRENEVLRISTLRKATGVSGQMAGRFVKLLRKSGKIGDWDNQRQGYMIVKSKYVPE